MTLSDVTRSLISRSLSLFSPSHAMDLRQFVSRFESHFPPPLAEKWDNVGLLVEPTGYKPGTNFGVTYENYRHYHTIISYFNGGDSCVVSNSGTPQYRG